MPVDDNDSRIDRLITAIEVQTNVIAPVGAVARAEG
jgi:hypothetical protein